MAVDLFFILSGFVIASNYLYRINSPADAKAFVILRVGHVASPELEVKLKDHVRHVLGSIAVPAEIAFPDKLPKTRSGKIIRRLLKAQETGGEVGDLSTLEE